MRLHDIADRVHHATHQHTLMRKEGVGAFQLCAWRLPWARTDVAFRPDFSAAGWYYVPAVEDEHGTLLFRQLVNASNAEQAMALLRRQYAQMAETDAPR